jgi:hypothetical protein
MASPQAVAGTIKGLSSTTFVAEVTGPTLAVLVPLLTRALKERSTDTQRMTCVVVGNLVKLVRDPTVAARYLSPLVGGVQHLAQGAAFPEIRAFAQTALDILLAAGASASATPLPERDIILSVTEALTSRSRFRTRLSLPMLLSTRRMSLPIWSSFADSTPISGKLAVSAASSSSSRAQRRVSRLPPASERPSLLSTGRSTPLRRPTTDPEESFCVTFSSVWHMEACCCSTTPISS